jgi:signal transduction histidine kinase
VADPALFGFPDGPRSELERTIGELMERAQEVLSTQGRLRSLVRANSLVTANLDLGQVLRRIAEAAVELVDAEYGALGVVAPDGRLEQFIHVGIPDADAGAIGHLPEGHGLLGAVVDTGENIRIPLISSDPRSAGFPEHHPHMGSFLGVPIRVRDEVYGNLYLTNGRRGEFTAEDEELVAALAATAGIAIEHARLFDESTRRQRWTAALAEVTSALLSGSADVLAVIADKVGSVVDADLVCVIVPAQEDGALVVRLARGADAEKLEGRVFSASGTLAGRALADDAIVSAEWETAPTEWQPTLGPSIALPLKAAGQALGVLTLSRHPGSGRFIPGDLDMAADFAAQAGVAIELGRAREDRQRLELVGERGRIARDLHDHVIQRLFAAGLSLQVLAAAAPDQSDAIIEQVTAIDAAIADIRTAIFALSSDRGTTTRHRILDIATEAAPALGFSPRVVFTGAVDLMVTGPLADDVVAVVRESLANVARHAAARSASVEIAADDDGVSVIVEDDGVGPPTAIARRSGTSNLAERASSRAGAYSLAPRVGGGARAAWSAPWNPASPPEASS